MDTGKCNILMIIDSLGMGGAERCVQLLSSEMVANDHRVVVLVIRDKIEIQLDAGVVVEVLGFVKYKYLPKYTLNAIRLRRKLSVLESRYGAFDLIVSNLTLSNRLSSIARIRNIYYCIHENLSISNLAKRKGLSKVIRRSRISGMLKGKRIITVSEGIKNDLTTNLNVRAGLIKTIYNPVNTGLVRKKSAGTNPCSNLKYIVHVGRMSAEKRHDVLLEAYKLSAVDQYLVLVGDGPERRAIMDKINVLGLGGKVILTGMLENPYPVIKGADLLVLSSDYEGFGIVIAEALALHTLVVSTDCKSGPGEIMSPRFADYLAPVGDVNELSRKIRKALDDLKYERVAMDGTETDRFSVGKIAQQYLSLCSK